MKKSPAASVSAEVPTTFSDWPKSDTESPTLIFATRAKPRSSTASDPCG